MIRDEFGLPDLPNTPRWLGQAANVICDRIDTMRTYYDQIPPEAVDEMVLSYLVGYGAALDMMGDEEKSKTMKMAVMYIFSQKPYLMAQEYARQYRRAMQ